MIMWIVSYYFCQLVHQFIYDAEDFHANLNFIYLSTLMDLTNSKYEKIIFMSCINKAAIVNTIDLILWIKHSFISTLLNSIGLNTNND